MPKRLLAIGVGGSGKTALTIFKERLEETYGEVPDNVVLLSFDTDDLRDGDQFAGTRLVKDLDGRGREPEFHAIVSREGVTMDTIIRDLNRGSTVPYMGWLQKEKLERILSPAQKDIRGGAQQLRPIGRVALFQRWNEMSLQIERAIRKMYGEADEESVSAGGAATSKRQIFIVGSVAGGTGSGFMLDVANLVRRSVNLNPIWKSVEVSAVIVLPDAFRSYISQMEDPTNLRPNSYAALREIDRFMRVHSSEMPYLVRYTNTLESVTWGRDRIFDHVYLLDTAGRSAIGDLDLSGDPKIGVFPVVSDLIMAHTDQSLSDELATQRSNAGRIYDHVTGLLYSSFNVLSYIFPIDDVIDSFSYRFLRDLLSRQYLPPKDAVQRGRLDQLAEDLILQSFAQSTVGRRPNPALLQKAIAATRKVDPERIDLSWTSLYSLITLSDSAFAEDFQRLERWMTYLQENLIPSRVGQYKNESYEDGYQRLVAFSDQYLDDCLGRRIERDNEESRIGGQWDAILGTHVGALRQRFADALDAALVETLNMRDPESGQLLPGRLSSAITMVATLRNVLVRFKRELQQQYQYAQIDTRLRHASQEVRDALTAMYEARTKPFALPICQPPARKAQEAYIAVFKQRVDLALQQRVYRIVVETLDVLGAVEHDSAGNRTVIEAAAVELELWLNNFSELDRWLVAHAERLKEARAEKNKVRVRRYLSDESFENQLYRDSDLISDLRQHVLGRVAGISGIEWRRTDARPFAYGLVHNWGGAGTQQPDPAMAQERRADGDALEKFAARMFEGVKLALRPLRQRQTVADRLAESFGGAANFVAHINQITEPFLRYNISANDGHQMQIERYISFNASGSSERATLFFDKVKSILRDKGVQIDGSAESSVACTILVIARGVRLSAVDQFESCAASYREKLRQGKDPLHLFPEEQIATEYENRIVTLGESDNRQRSLSPELVVAMGDEAQMKAFVLACAYNLIQEKFYEDANGEQTKEIFYMPQGPAGPQVRLSNGAQIRRSDVSFDAVAQEERIPRLFLNALQNFVLLATERRGVQLDQLDMLIASLNNQGVSLDHIAHPFTLTVKDVNEAIKQARARLSPEETLEPDPTRRLIQNSRRCIEPGSPLRAFERGRLAEFKSSKTERIRDMATVMDLIIRREIEDLEQIARTNSA